MSAGLVFYPASHRYKLDGEWVPGVTTLIGKGFPKPAIPYWAARTVAEWVFDNAPLSDQLAEMGGRGPAVAFLKQLPWQKRDDAAVRGTDVHALAERLVHGEAVQVPERLSAYVDGYVEWLNESGAVPLWTECPVASRKWGYAGKFDLIGELDGATWLLDVKTSSGVYGETAMQLAAYANCEFLLDPDGKEQPMPTIDRLGVLHVTEEGTRLVPVREGQEESAWKDFLHVAWIGKGADRIKTYFEETA